LAFTDSDNMHFAVGHTECYKLVDQWQKATRTMCSWLNVWSLPVPRLDRVFIAFPVCRELGRSPIFRFW